MFNVEGGHPIEIAAGAASRPYNYDRSRIYQGVIGFLGPKARGWLYDRNLVTSYSSNGARGALGADAAITVEPLPLYKNWKFWAVVGGCVAAAGAGTMIYRRRR